MPFLQAIRVKNTREDSKECQLSLQVKPIYVRYEENQEPLTASAKIEQTVSLKVGHIY